ncbi:MAG: hypothetical protein IT385_17025 [Deltaproteobacteria bacterium]|nr:hypothetical protein [Deltaproteobacteria bacterium]
MTTRAALDHDLASAPELSRRLEKLGVLAPVARASARGGAVYYDAGVASIVERARALLGAGYASKDIALVLGRVEEGRREPVIEVADLAEVVQRTGVAAERIAGPEGWVARGLVPVWGRDGADAPLFASDVVPRVRVLAALEALGMGALAADWLAGAIDVPRVRARLAEIQAAVKLLTRAMPKVGRRRKGRVRGQTRTLQVRQGS